MTRRDLVPVPGSGIPIKPGGLPDGVGIAWERLHGLTTGIACEQDSEALTAGAWLLWRREKLQERLAADPCNEALNRLSLAVDRAFLSILMQFGLTPKARQTMLIPREGPEDDDEFERMLAERDT